MSKIKLTPTGHTVLVKELKNDNHVTEGKIELIDLTFRQGVIVETTILPEYKEVYKVGSIVMYNKDSGQPQTYNVEQCIWLNCKPFNEGGMIIAVIETEE